MQSARGGGRVTALTAIPLLRAFYPTLGNVQQPLAGEFGLRWDLLVQTPFSTGYAVEMALLIDVYEQVGIGALAQVDLDVRQNRHQPLEHLTGMATEVLAAVTDRLVRDGRLAGTGVATEIVQRPPLADLATTVR